MVCDGEWSSNRTTIALYWRHLKRCNRGSNCNLAEKVEISRHIERRKPARFRHKKIDGGRKCFQHQLQRRERRRHDERGRQWNIASDNQVEPQVFRWRCQRRPRTTRTTLSMLGSHCPAGHEAPGLDCRHVDIQHTCDCRYTASVNRIRWCSYSLNVIRRRRLARRCRQDFQIISVDRPRLLIICHLYKTTYVWRLWTVPVLVVQTAFIIWLGNSRFTKVMALFSL